MSIKNRIFNCLPEKLQITAFKSFSFNNPCGFGEVFSESLNKAFDVFLTPEEKYNSQLKKVLTNDIVRCWILYKALPYEYFSLDMRNADKEKRASYMTDVETMGACEKYSGLESFVRDISDKYAFYKLMQPYFGRKVFHVDSSTDRNQFVKFATEVNSLFCKINKGSRGAGAFSEEIKNEQDAIDLFKKLTLNTGEDWIVEEKIVQCEEMARWNASCVNTVRLPAILSKSGFHVIDPFLRTGRAGAVVDNAGQGGVFAGIDPETGVITTDGVDELGHGYTKHPDSKLKFKGWQVPRWKELLDAAKKAHCKIPHQKYIGWDFALTDNGWVLIEANWGQLVGQYATKVGVREQFMRYIVE